MNQNTILQSFSLSGPGLHTGKKTKITFKPALDNTGVVFVRDDLAGRPEIHVEFAKVLGVTRGTTIGTEEVHAHTVEHILSALSAMGVDNVFVHLNASEPPVMDGSAKPYADAIKAVGLSPQSAPKNYFAVSRRVEYSSGGTTIIAEPSDGFEIDCSIEYDHPMIGSQRFSVAVTPEKYMAEIAAARTFCLDYEIEAIHARGYGKGGDLTNTVVFSMDKVHADGSLRFSDEPVRHKLLDLIGDLALLGRPLKAKITAVRSGHLHNINFLKKIVSEHSIQKTEGKMPLPEIKVGETILSADIQKIIPHRYPFLMIDKVVVTESGKRAVGYKSVSGNEPFFQGHFPGNPIMPGVLIVEAMAQTSCVLFLSRPDISNKMAYFMGIDQAKFRKPVLPGDNLELRIEVLKAKERVGKVKGEAFVGDKLVTEAEFTFVLVDK